MLLIAGCKEKKELINFICSYETDGNMWGKPAKIVEDRFKENWRKAYIEYPPFSFDSETGELYEYDMFKEAMVPLKEENTLENDISIDILAYEIFFSEKKREWKAKQTLYRYYHANGSKIKQEEFIYAYSLQSLSSSKEQSYPSGGAVKMSSKCMQFHLPDDIKVEWTEST